jgi:hypothetical protein
MNKKKLNKPVLAEGEFTGHAHVLDRKVSVYEREDGIREFNIRKRVKVKHQEHKEIEIPNGEWESDKVTEVDPYTEEIRKVQD